MKYLFKSIFLALFCRICSHLPKLTVNYFYEVCCKTGRLNTLVKYYILNKEIQWMGFYVTQTSRHERVNM